MTHKKIACVGEAMIELNIDRVGQQIGFAGDTLNTAIYLARAFEGAGTVEYVTVLGRDVLSDRMEAFIASESVGTSRILRHPERLPGIYSIAVDAKGERSFSYWRNQSAARCLFENGFAQLAGFDLIYLSGITLAILPHATRLALLNHLASHPALIAFDSNYRPSLWEDAATARAVIDAAWRIADIGLPSLDDEMALFGDGDAGAVLARLRASGLRHGALKQGAAGPAPISAEVAPASFPVAQSVIDTTAAGDSFNGVYLAASQRGRPEAEALALAHAEAVRVIGHRGAIIPRKVQPEA
jgi:2-dehydro-3-deoxygluconokinase